MTSSCRHTPGKPAAAAALASLLVFAMSTSALPVVLLRAADALSVSRGFLAQVGAVQFLGYFVASISGGLLSDTIGKKHVLLGACGMLTVGATIWTLAAGTTGVFTGGFLMGAGGGVLESMSSTVLSDLYPFRRKFFLNISQAVYCLGALIGPLIMSQLLPMGFSWRVIFAAIAVAGAGLAILYMMCTLPVPTQSERIHLQAVRIISCRRSFVLPCLALFLYVLAESGVILYGNLYLQTKHSAPEAWAVSFLTLFWIGMMAGRWLCAMIPEKISTAHLTAGLLTLSAATLILQQWVGNWIMSLVLFVLTGFCFAGIWPLIVGMSASINHGYSGTVLGATIAAGSLGGIAAPTVMNALFKHLPCSAVFPASALPLLASALILLCVGSHAEK